MEWKTRWPSVAKQLTVSAFPICRLSPSKRRLFTMQKAVFYTPKGRLLHRDLPPFEVIRSSGVWNIKPISANIQLRARQSVTVIPRSDAESSVCSQYRLESWMFSGFRVGARNDSYRLPGLQQNMYTKCNDKSKRRCNYLIQTNCG